MRCREWVRQLDERVSTGQRATDDPTDTHRTTTREELGHDVGAGGTTTPADAAFFHPFFSSFPLPLPLIHKFLKPSRQLLLLHKLVEPTAKRTSDSQHEYSPSSTAELTTTRSHRHTILQGYEHRWGSRSDRRPARQRRDHHPRPQEETDQGRNGT